MDCSSEHPRAEIYGLRAHDSGKYFYVGVTCYRASERLTSHLCDVRRGTHSNKHFTNKVLQVGEDNVVLDVLERPLLAVRWQRESFWIKERLAVGDKLVNRIHNDLYIEPGRNIEDSRVIIREFLDAPPVLRSPKMEEVYKLVYELARSVYDSYTVYSEEYGKNETYN